jgi:hypothetical protein
MTKRLAVLMPALWLCACVSSTGGSTAPAPASTTLSKPAHCAFEASDAAMCIGRCDMHQSTPASAQASACRMNCSAGPDPHKCTPTCDGLEAQASGERMHAYHSCIHACNTATPRPECR